MPGRVHHVFVRDRESGVWCHQTAFADRADAEFERDDYREKPSTWAVRLITGPDHLPFIQRKLAELNGVTQEAYAVSLNPNADHDLLDFDWIWRQFGERLMLVTETRGAKVVLCSDTPLRTRDHQGVLVPLTPLDPIAVAMTATPALLAACKRALPFLEGFEDDEMQDPPLGPLVAQVRAAIAKAEGRTELAAQRKEA